MWGGIFLLLLLIVGGIDIYRKVSRGRNISSEEANGFRAASMFLVSPFAGLLTLWIFEDTIDGGLTRLAVVIIGYYACFKITIGLADLWEGSK